MYLTWEPVSLHPHAGGALYFPRKEIKNLGTFFSGVGLNSINSEFVLLHSELGNRRKTYV